MKTLVITGASRGIGLATARRFLDAGYHAINLSRSPTPDDRIEDHAIDLTGMEAEATIRELAQSLDGSREMVLVHNAAALVNDSAVNADTDTFRQVLELNIVAPHVLNRNLVGRMKGGSAIVYVGSTLSEKAVANSFSYVTTKHAMIGMMRSACQDLKGTGIHTACVCPGFTNTEMLKTHIGNDEGVMDTISASTTFGRLVEPEEIAETIYFAATNPVINGAVIHANLGQIES